MFQTPRYNTGSPFNLSLFLFTLKEKHVLKNLYFPHYEHYNAYKTMSSVAV